MREKLEARTDREKEKKNGSAGGFEEAKTRGSADLMMVEGDEHEEARTSGGWGIYPRTDCQPHWPAMSAQTNNLGIAFQFKPIYVSLNGVSESINPDNP